MTRFPAPLFRKLCQKAEPQTFGLRYVGYDGGVWLECVDRNRLQQTLHALQESMMSGNRQHVELHWRLERMLTAPTG